MTSINGHRLPSIAYGLVSVLAFVTAQELHYSLPEETSPDFRIANIANDSNLIDLITDEATKRNMRYRFLSQGNPYAQYFRISSTTGDLFTKTQIDRESLKHCEFSESCLLPLDIVAQPTIGTFFKRIKVNIEIKDINDNSPIFSSPTASIAISEASVIGTSFPIDGATDNDIGLNTIQHYYLLPENSPFAVQLKNFVDGRSSLVLVLNNTLDREVRPYYTILIIAEDGGDPVMSGTQTLNVNVTDVNDNKPVFSRKNYSITIDEDLPKGSIIMKLSAYDADDGLNGKVSYYLSQYQSQDILQIFNIHQENGDLTLAKSVMHERNKIFNIIVEATDSSSQPLLSQTNVNVKVKDAKNDPPRININTFSTSNISLIAESATLGAAVAHVTVFDEDTGLNGIVNCSINRQEFALQKLETDEFKVVVAMPLNREVVDSYIMRVTCQDAGNPSMTSHASFQVTVTDVNDNSPRFDKIYYHASIKENNRFGEKVLKVSASDLDSGNNGAILYSLNQIGDFDFVINPETGDIYANFVLDRETISEINFKVVATDGGTPPRSSVANVNVSVLDRNDHKPEFNKSLYSFTVRENLPVHTFVGKISASDKDTGRNGEIKYIIKSRSLNVPMVISSNGSIFTSDRLDRELFPHGFQFQVAAVDGGAAVSWNSTCYVSIFITDENDNDPIILFPNDVNYTISVLYDTPINSVIGRIIAKDIDYGKNSALTYSFIGSDFFDIQFDKGDIYVSKQLTASDIGRYTLTIIVEDQGNPNRGDNQTLILLITSHQPMGDLSIKTSSDTYMLIAVSISCVTVVMAGLIILVIFLIRRHDKNKQAHSQNSAKKTGHSNDMYDAIDRSIKINSLHGMSMNERTGSISLDLSADNSQDQLLGERNSLQSNQSEDDIEKILERVTPVSNYSRSSRNSSFSSHQQFAQIRSSLASNTSSLHSSQSRGSYSLPPSNDLHAPQSRGSYSHPPSNDLHAPQSRGSYSHPTSSDHHIAQRPEVYNVSDAKKVVLNGKLRDDDSETSMESNTSDSGRGGSESDVQINNGGSQRKELGSTRSLKIIYQTDGNHRLKRHLSDQAIPLHDFHPNDEYIIIKNPNYSSRSHNSHQNCRDINTASSNERKFKQKPTVRWNPITRVLNGTVATIDENDDGSTTTSGSYTVEDSRIEYSNKPDSLV